MSTKKFIGSVTEKIFEQGGAILRVSLSKKDRELLAKETGDYVTIAVKKSLKGVWYAEIDNYESSKHKADLK